MLLPPFSGVGLKAFDRAGAEITERLFVPSGFMKVDADYTPKPYEEWKAADWPRTYQSPEYPNLFAAGIAFAPPHAISKPRQSPAGTVIAPAPPRTGMPSAMIGKAVTRSIVDMIRGAAGPTHTASMAEMGAACVASAGANPFTGTAASMTVFPDRPGLRALPRVRARPEAPPSARSASPATGSRSSSTTCSSTRPDSAPAGTGSRSRAMRDDHSSYATRPTRRTLFMRTFCPGRSGGSPSSTVKMIGIIRRSH